MLFGKLYRAESTDIKKTDYGIKARYISNYEDSIKNTIVFYDGDNGECSGYICDANIFSELGDKNRIDFRIYEVQNGDVYMDIDICRLDNFGFLKDGNREAGITVKYNISKMILSPVVIPYDEYKEVLPFYKNIEYEGIDIYSNKKGLVAIRF